jgi:hypothetical protein
VVTHRLPSADQPLISCRAGLTVASLIQIILFVIAIGVFGALWELEQIRQHMGTIAPISEISS